ncbi:MAG: DUF3726 domain-containing protein [bacterium]|jgi:hypothetical protein
MPEPSLLFALSEIQALATKATRGAGFSWGEAEEAGWAVMWLSREGLPGADLLLAAIESPELCAPTPQPFCWRTPGQLCPLRAGMALMDFAELPSGLANTPLHLEEVAVPGLLLPFVAQAAHQLAQPLLLHAPEMTIVFRTDGAPQSLPAELSLNTLHSTTTITLTKAPDFPSAKLPPLTDYFAPLSSSAQHRLEQLALRTTVPPSSQSRSRAGASGSDND